MAEGLSAREFLDRELRANPDASFADLEARGRALGISVPPFLYGSARRALGLPARPDLTEPAARPAPLAAERAEAEPEARDEDHSVEAEAVAGEPAPAEAKGSAFQFAVETLRLSPDISFQDLKLRAGMAGLKMQPIVYGRAKALLGLVPTKPRQPRRSREEAPRTLRQVESAAILQAQMPNSEVSSTLDNLVNALRALEGERQRLRATLAAIQATVDQALRAEDL